MVGFDGSSQNEISLFALYTLKFISIPKLTAMLGRNGLDGANIYPNLSFFGQLMEKYQQRKEEVYTIQYSTISSPPLREF